MTVIETAIFILSLGSGKTVNLIEATVAPLGDSYRDVAGSQTFEHLLMATPHLSSIPFRFSKGAILGTLEQADLLAN